MIGDVPDHPNIWSDGTLNPSHILMLKFLERQWGHTQDLDGRFNVAPRFSLLSLDLCEQSKELNIGAPFSPSRLPLVYMVGLITSGFPRASLLPSSAVCFEKGVMIQSRFPRLEVALIS